MQGFEFGGFEGREEVTSSSSGWSFLLPLWIWIEKEKIVLGQQRVEVSKVK